MYENGKMKGEEGCKGGKIKEGANSTMIHCKYFGKHHNTSIIPIHLHYNNNIIKKREKWKAIDKQNYYPKSFECMVYGNILKMGWKLLI
jgi:hypothetical protein